jgi:patatin-like phospholipase/acyl hydrolase
MWPGFPPPLTLRINLSRYSHFLGGYRGLFTASVLEKLEERTGRPAREAFDLIAGTSIGGIIACGLACGISAADIRKSIQKRGAEIFKREGMARIPGAQLFTNLYSQTGLRNTISDVLGEFAKVPIAEVEAPLLVVAVSSADAKPVVFESEAASPPERCETPLVDVALSTSAAPTYFPVHRVGTQNLIDGGIIANSPDTIALMRALGRFGRLSDQIRRLFSVTTQAQETLSIQLAREVLGDRYIRIDVTPGVDEQAAIGLDIADETATQTLLQIADRALPRPANSVLNAIIGQRAGWVGRSS